MGGTEGTRDSSVLGIALSKGTVFSEGHAAVAVERTVPRAVGVGHSAKHAGSWLLPPCPVWLLQPPPQGLALRHLKRADLN